MQYNIVNKKGINYQCIKTTWIKLGNTKVGEKKSDRSVPFDSIHVKF